MSKVTKESLMERIASIDATERAVGLSLQAEYNREAYRKLLQFMEGYAKLGYVIHDFEDYDEVKCKHEWVSYCYMDHLNNCRVSKMVCKICHEAK